MIRLVEYSRASTKLRKDDRDYLLTLLKGGGAGEHGVFQSIAPTTEDDYYEVTPGPFVGRLGLPSGESIDIESRFPFHDVIRLISFSGRLPAVLENLRAEMPGSPFLVDLIAEAFIREVDRVIGRGLAKGYVRRRFLEPPYPGVLDATFHLSRLHGRPDRIATVARRLTQDIEVNQVLATALSVLTGAKFTHTSTGSRVAKLSRAFRTVSLQFMTASQVRSIRLQRLYSYYREAVPLAALIIEGNSVAPTGTGLAGASILFHMPKVWEDCVLRWVKAKWGPEYRVESQHTFNLSSKAEMRSAADVVVWEGKQLLALYDAKYKVPGTTPDVADVYQMVTYCERLGLKEATLVYPVSFSPRDFRVGGRTIRMLGLHQVVNGVPESDELVAAG